MEEDPFDFIQAEAGAISSSQEEILRRSRFIRSAPPASSSSSSSSSSSVSSSSSSGGGEGNRLGAASVPYRISDHPIVMRSASDSPYSSSSSSDARGGGASRPQRGRYIRRAQEANGPVEERPDVGDGGEGLGLPGDGGDRQLERRGEKQSRFSKRKRSPEEEKKGEAGRTGKKLRALSDESTQEPEDSPVASPCSKLVARSLGFSGSDKEAAEPARRVGNPQTVRSVVEDEGGSRLADDEFAKFRYVRTGVPSLRHSPPELLKNAPGSPKPACGGALGVRQAMSPVARDPADRVVIKSVSVGSPLEAGKGATGLHRPPPSIRDPADGQRDDGSGTLAGFHGSLPLEAGPDTSVQLLNPGQKPEVERPPGTGLGTSSPVEILEQSEGQRAVERVPSGGAQSPPPPTKSAPKGGALEIRQPSDLVDLLLKFSKKPDRRLENVDFLEVLAMKGIHIPPPRWWRPGGYGPPKKKA